MQHGQEPSAPENSKEGGKRPRSESTIPKDYTRGPKRPRDGNKPTTYKNVLEAFKMVIIKESYSSKKISAEEVSMRQAGIIKQCLF
jgi:hypothetical protein